jgi:hypothetical protein
MIRARTLSATCRELCAPRYEPDDWREVIQPINDELRGLQRDALVAYVLHEMRSRPATTHIDTPDKLFEVFPHGRADGSVHADSRVSGTRCRRFNFSSSAA